MNVRAEPAGIAPAEAAGPGLARRLWRASRPTLEVFLMFLALTALAQLILTLADVREFLVPKPTTVAESIADNSQILIENGWVTLQEILIGFAAAALGGFSIAVLLVYVPAVGRFVYPLIVASQTIPKIAIAPLLVVWFGFGLLPKIVCVFLIAFFPVVISSAVGLRSVDPNMLHLVRSMGASSFEAFYKVRLINAVPQIYSGLKIAITLSVIGAIVGEFVGADSGLGYLLLIANGQLDTPLMFAVIVVLSGMGIALFAIVSALEKITPGHARDRNDGELVSATY